MFPEGMTSDGCHSYVCEDWEDVFNRLDDVDLYYCDDAEEIQKR